MLKIDNITFSYPRQREAVLSGISLTINSGGIYGLLGRNGVGKSTLLYLIAGLLTPKQGKVTLYDVNTRLRKPETMADIFIVPEEISLPAISLEKYIKLNAPFYPRFSADDMRRHLDTFGMSSDINLGRLSMGQKKKAFMSFALATNTPLILMDEPTNGLDIPGKSSFRSFIASNMTDERAIVISTHQVRDINLLLDHIIILERNGVLLNESVSDITSRLRFVTTTDTSLIERALFATPSLQGTNIIIPGDGKESEVDLENLFEFAVTYPDIIQNIFTQTNIINNG